MQKKSLSTLKKELSNYPHFNSLEKFVKKITETADPVLLLLFGSLARKHYTQFSDIDLLCVFDMDFQDHKERFLHSYQFSDGIVQTKTLSLSELKNGLLEGNSFLHLIFEEGILIHYKIDIHLLEEWITEGKENVMVTYIKPY